MEQSPSWEGNSHSANHKILCLLWNLNVHHCVHKSPLFAPVLSQVQPVHTFPLYFPKIHCNIIRALHIGLLRGVFSLQVFQPKFCCISHHCLNLMIYFINE